MSRRLAYLAFPVIALVLLASGCVAPVTTTVTTTVTATAPTTVTVTKTVEKTATITVTATPTPTPTKKLKFAFLIFNAGYPYSKMLIKGAEAAAKELGAELTVYDARDDPHLQLTQAEEVIVKGYNGVLLDPVHRKAICPGMEKVNKAGIPVVTCDDDIDCKEYRVCFTGSNNKLGGELGAKTLLKGLEEAGKKKPYKIVIMNGYPGTMVSELRKEGFHAVLDPLVEKGEVEIVLEEWGYYDAAKAMTIMETLLAKRKDIDGVVCANDDMALGVIKAIEAAGLTPGKDIIVVGYDAIEEAIKAIKEGKLYGTIAQSPFLQGYWGIRILYHIIVDKWKPPDFIPTPLVAVTMENVDKYRLETEVAKPVPGAPS